MERAKNHGIPTRVIPRKNYPDSKTFSADLLKALQEEKADLVVYAGFMTIVDECVAKAFSNKTRQKCKDIKCVDCKYQNVCLESEINDGNC